jgi:hypothetical protein
VGPCADGAAAAAPDAPAAAAARRRRGGAPPPWLRRSGAGQRSSPGADEQACCPEIQIFVPVKGRVAVEPCAAGASPAPPLNSVLRGPPAAAAADDAASPATGSPIFFSPASTYAEDPLQPLPPPHHALEAHAARPACRVEEPEQPQHASGPVAPPAPLPARRCPASSAGGAPLAERAACLRAWLEGELGRERLVLAYRYLLQIEEQQERLQRAPPGVAAPPGGGGRRLPELLAGLLGEQVHLALQVQRLLLWEEQLAEAAVAAAGGRGG